MQFGFFVYFAYFFISEKTNFAKKMNCMDYARKNTMKPVHRLRSVHNLYILKTVRNS